MKIEDKSPIVLSEYNPLEENLKHERYHHSHKGCSVDCRYDGKFSTEKDRKMQYIYCKTHNVYCSKTGWEFHWYNGTDSLQFKIRTYPLKCHICGEYFVTDTEEKKKICENCININKNY